MHLNKKPRNASVHRKLRPMATMRSQMLEGCEDTGTPQALPLGV